MQTLSSVFLYEKWCSSNSLADLFVVVVLVKFLVLFEKKIVNYQHSTHLFFGECVTEFLRFRSSSVSFRNICVIEGFFGCEHRSICIDLSVFTIATPVDQFCESLQVFFAKYLAGNH